MSLVLSDKTIHWMKSWALGINYEAKTCFQSILYIINLHLYNFVETSLNILGSLTINM